MTTRLLHQFFLPVPVEPSVHAPRLGRFDALWTALAPVCMLYVWAMSHQWEAGQVAAQAFRWLPLVSIMCAAAFGGMMLGLGVCWFAELRLDGRRSTQRRFGALLAGGVLTAAVALLLLPRQPQYPMSQIAPWIYLSATLLFLILGMIKQGSFDPAAVARVLAGTADRPRAEILRDYLTMTKPGLNGLVLATTFIGFVLASAGEVDWVRCFWVMGGTTLVAGGSSVLNQVAERGPDALMRRTAGRPLPAGRVRASDALTFGILLCCTGLLTLALRIDLATAAVAAMTLASYVFLYTPLKRINSLSTLAGAITGGLPPMLGWLGAGNGLGAGAVILFFVLFYWQIPHFLAISWKYRDQYARAGYPMYGVLDPAGRATGGQALLYGIGMLVASLLLVQQQLAGWVYGAGALGLGGVMVALAIRFRRDPNAHTATFLFFATIIYLPLLLILLFFDAHPGV